MDWRTENGVKATSLLGAVKQAAVEASDTAYFLHVVCPKSAVDNDNVQLFRYYYQQIKIKAK